MDIKDLLIKFSIPPLKWTRIEIYKWLELLNMTEYAKYFDDNKVDGLVIFDIEDDDIENCLKITNRLHRKRLRNGITLLRSLQKHFDDLNKNLPTNNNTHESDQEESKKKNLKKRDEITSLKDLDFGSIDKYTNIRYEESKIVEQKYPQQGMQYPSQVPQYPQQGQQNPQQGSQNPQQKPQYPQQGPQYSQQQVQMNSKDFLRRGNMTQDEIITNGPKPLRMPSSVVDEEKIIASEFLEELSQLNQDIRDPIVYGDNEEMQIESIFENNMINQKHLSNNEPIIMPSAFPFTSNQKFPTTTTCPSHHNQDIGSGGVGVIGGAGAGAGVGIGVGITSLGHQLFKPNLPKQKQPAELVIQPMDGTQANNFYCVDIHGAKIGRHSDNQIILLEESVSRHHSIIEYKDDKFYLVDIGSTTGTFIKIDNILRLSEGLVLELGSNHFHIESIKRISENEGLLTLKIIEGPNFGNVYEIKNIASIGRKNLGECSLVFNDDFHLSNLHAKITYVEGQYLFEDQNSTNGSWLRLSPQGVRSQPYELIDKIIFKIGSISSFTCRRATSDYANNAKKQAEETKYCMICLKNDKDALFLPCKHNVVCSGCSVGIKNCLVCKMKITESIKIFK